MKQNPKESFSGMTLIISLFIIFPILLALFTLLSPMDVHAEYPPAFIGSPTPLPNGTPNPPVEVSHTAELVADIDAGDDGSYPDNLFEFEGKLYFSAYYYDPLGGNDGRELFAYDGVNITLVADINPYGDSSPNDFAVFEDKLYFSAVGLDESDNPIGRELYCYDGNSVVLVADIYPGETDSDPKSFTVYDGELYFHAVGMDEFGQPVGAELYKYDGLQVTLVADLIAGTVGSSPRYLFTYQGELYLFARREQAGTDPIVLVQYDGTQFTYISENNPVSQPIEYQGIMYFGADGVDDQGEPVGEELFQFDGFEVLLVADIVPGTYEYDDLLVYRSSRPQHFTIYDGLLYFIGQYTDKIYTYDGHTLVSLWDQLPSSGYPMVVGTERWGNPLPESLVKAGDALYFYGRYYDMFEHSLYPGIFRYDGVNAEFIDIFGYSLGSTLNTYAGNLFFRGNGSQLWMINTDPGLDTTLTFTQVSPSPSLLGEAVTFSVSVTAENGGTPQGIVDVGDGGGNNCQITLVDGSGSCDLIFDQYDLYSIYARYKWGTEYYASSNTISHVVSLSAPEDIWAMYTDPEDGVVVTWEQVLHADQYKLYRASSETGEKTLVYTGSETQANDYHAACGDNYYWVTACVNGHCSDYSDFDTEFFPDTAPPTGTFLTPSDGGILMSPRSNLLVDASDGEGCGVKHVIFSAYYGGGWHQLYVDDDPSDGWLYKWVTQDISDSKVHVRAVIVDQANYSTTIQLNDLEISSSRSVGGNDNFQTRGDGDEETGETEQMPAQQPESQAGEAAAPVELILQAIPTLKPSYLRGSMKIFMQ